MPIWRDPKFNPHLQPDGSLNFSGVFKRVHYQANPLTAIIDGLTREKDRPKDLMEWERQVYLQKIICGRAVIPGVKLATCLNLRTEMPLPLDDKYHYHGYELVKVSTGEIVVRRMIEIRTQNSWKFKPIGEEYHGYEPGLKELFKQADQGHLKERDHLSGDIAKLLYQIWR